MTARYSAASLRRMAVQTVRCFACKRLRVRADLGQCPKCGVLVCDGCSGHCFCTDSQRVTETARTLVDN